MKNKEMFLETLKIHGVDLDTCNKNELKELEKKELLEIAAGYHEFHKGNFYDKEQYYKVDTPWGGMG